MPYFWYIPIGIFTQGAFWGECSKVRSGFLYLFANI